MKSIIIFALAGIILLDGINVLVNGIKCNTNMTVIVSWQCYANLTLDQLDGPISTINATNITGLPVDNRYPIGVTRLNYTNNGTGDTSACLDVVIELMNETNPCAYDGRCNTTPPFDCICGSGTCVQPGSTCCPLLADGTSCGGGNGICNLPGGFFTCDAGFGGTHCCPMGNSTDGTGVITLCSSSGCCTENGTCACFDGFDGIDCSQSTETPSPPQPIIVTEDGISVANNKITWAATAAVTGTVLVVVVAAAATGGTAGAATGTALTAASTTSSSATSSSAATELTPIRVSGRVTKKYTPLNRNNDHY